LCKPTCLLTAKSALIHTNFKNWRKILTKEFMVGDTVVFSGIDGTQSNNGTVTYVIRDGSNSPWGYIMVHSPDGTSYICHPDKLVCTEPKQ
jgi:hypothetical protein